MDNLHKKKRICYLEKKQIQTIMQIITGKDFFMKNENEEGLTKEFIESIKKHNIGKDALNDACLFFMDFLRTDKEKSYVKKEVSHFLENNSDYNKKFFESWYNLNHVNFDKQLSFKKEFPNYNKSQFDYSDAFEDLLDRYKPIKDAKNIEEIDFSFGVKNTDDMKKAYIVTKDIPENIIRKRPKV